MDSVNSKVLGAIGGEPSTSPVSMP